MNKWVIIGLIVLAVLIIVGVAYDQGAFESMDGSIVAIILTAIAAPFMAVKNMLFGNKQLRVFKDKYETLRAEELIHRDGLDQSISAKEQRIAQLDKEIQLLDAKMEVLELKKKKVAEDVNKMSVDETKKEVRNLFGD